jgi:hypothetical protein
MENSTSIENKKTDPRSLENQFIYPIPRGSKLIFFAPLGAGVNEEPTIPRRSGEELDEVKINE